MIIRADTAVSFPIEFPSGQPDGNVVWKLYGPGSTQLDTGTIAVPVGALSINLLIDAPNNGLGAGEYASYRDLTWTYTVGGAVVNGEVRYTLEARLPFGVSTDGVRAKLGITEALDLPDGDISLVKAFSNFRSIVTPAVLDPAVSSGLYDLAVRDAIEAMAALDLLPTMVVRVAAKESSGTNTYQRQDIDWQQIGVYLSDLITSGILVLVPGYSVTIGFGDLFVLASPAEDAFTGAAL